jgi:hypothetical protein
MWFGFTHMYSFINQEDWNLMLKRVDKDVQKYWRIKDKLERRTLRGF